MTPKEIITDLRESFPHIQGKILLTPEDLSPIIHKSPAHQSKLRSEGRFHIPIQPRAKNEAVEVSIYDLADFLSQPNTYQKEHPLPVNDSPKRGRPTGTTKSQMTLRTNYWQQVDLILFSLEEREILMATFKK